MKKILVSFLCCSIGLIGLTDHAIAKPKKNRDQSYQKQASLLPSLNSKYYGAELCRYSQFQCTTVKGSWYNLFPNEQQRLAVQRLNRSNVSSYSRPWIVIPKNLAKINYMELSPFPAKRNTNGNRLVVISLQRQAFGAYNEGGRLVHWGPASSAKGYCPDVHRKCTTPIGRFAIEYKKGADCISHRFPVKTKGGAKMPYCMFFYKGFALHGSYELPGFNASHGCVRIYPADAKWLNQEFTHIGTPVIVTDY